MTSKESVDHIEDTTARLKRQATPHGADYEAQYFDNKPEPRGDTFRKIGNPSTL